MNRNEGQANPKGKFLMIVLGAFALVAIIGFGLVQFFG